VAPKQTDTDRERPPRRAAVRWGVWLVVLVSVLHAGCCGQRRVRWGCCTRFVASENKWFTAGIPARSRVCRARSHVSGSARHLHPTACVVGGSPRSWRRRSELVCRERI
jgi:hypothetical protein